jgi:NAD(P)-dependent dehydrogenase (short-subunit alcohol dehydrogenase family)
VSDELDLGGKVVLLTGASGGIGSVTARLLLERGALLVGHYGNDRAGAEAACAQAPADRVLLVQADLAELGGSRALWREALAWRGRVDVVVANAAVAINLPFDAADDEWDAGWERTLRVNVIEPASLIRAALPHFIERGSGVVVTISSWAAQRGSALPPHTAYAASKAALQNLTQSIARNHTADGVLAYVIAPGIVRTPMAELSATARGGVDAVNAILPMGEMVPPLEVARLIALLASGTVRHLAGGTIDLNGAANIR